MKIGYVLDDTLDKSDGVQQAMIAIAEEIRRRGHEVHYLVPTTGRKDLVNVHQLSKVISLKFNGNSVRTPIWSSGRKIKSVLKNIGFDALHVQLPYSPVFGAKVIRHSEKNTVLVGTFHILPYGFLARLGTKILGLLLFRTKHRLHAVYATSAPARDFMKTSFGLDGSVAANPVDYEYFHQAAPAKRTEGKKRIVFVGRFEERKGVKQLVDAYENLPDRSNVELIMCGKGPLLEDLKALALQKKLSVSFPGFISEEEKAGLLSSSDIAVFPSVAGESFGIVLTESMSAGAGVTLGGNNPGYASVLGAWPETLFDPNDIAAFTAKLEQFLNNETLKDRIASAQHEDVKRYDIKVIADKLEHEAYQ